MTPLLLLLFLTTTTSTAINDEPSTMSAIAAALSPLPSDWSTTTDYCKWSGISCDGTHNVAAINLPSQSLTGSLPPSLSSLTHLTSLFLQNNLLSGPLPLFTHLSVLQNIYLDNNNFTSVLPHTFSGLTSLHKLSLSDNVNLQPWEFPPELSDSETLVSVFANNVNLVGTLPDVFGSLTSLQDLRLSYNNLTGALPSSLNGSGVQTLWVNDQAEGLSGSIRVVSGMTQLSQVWLQGNRFTGAIPDLTSCEKIAELELRNNQLTGVVPESLVDLPKLVNVSLQNNLLQGPLPVFPDTVIANLGESPRTNRFCKNENGDCDPQVTTLLLIAKDLGYPVELADQWKGNNVCDGWIYVTCDNEGKVVSVNFQKRGFVGTISPAFADLTNLRELYLNGNNLTGSIPDSLTKLDYLKKIDVSNNNLSGKVPVFRPGVSLLTAGNNNIGIEAASPSSRSNSSGSSGGSSVSAGLVAGVVIVVVVFVIVLIFVSYKCYMKRRRKQSGKVHNPEVGQEMVNPTKTTKGMNGYNGVDVQFPMLEGGNVAIPIQLIKQVTNNFSEENILGHGGFGVVYKGELHDGTKIAVKRMESSSSSSSGTKGMKEFEAEIGVLTKVRHKHLVALLGYCINDNERLLVYEYMPQGTLSQHLFEYGGLTWKQRVTIALDVARGVEYLHSLARTSFIHRDLKPSNILLGDDMRAKVADFGLVKNAPDGKHSIETRLAGTFGYLAPEYAVTGRVTTKIDVYAFGVILMELITGRKALDETLPDERSHLVTWFRRTLLNKDNLRNAIDKNLNPNDETYESISQVAELAGHCTTREPQQRPDMGHAVNVLVPLVEKWKPSSSQTDEDDEEENSYGGIDMNISLPQALLRWQANEGTSTLMGEQSFSGTQTSIPAKPSGFTDTFDSSDCR